MLKKISHEARIVIAALCERSPLKIEEVLRHYHEAPDKPDCLKRMRIAIADVDAGRLEITR